MAHFHPKLFNSTNLCYVPRMADPRYSILNNNCQKKKTLVDFCGYVCATPCKAWYSLIVSLHSPNNKHYLHDLALHDKSVTKQLPQISVINKGRNNNWQTLSENILSLIPQRCGRNIQSCILQDMHKRFCWTFIDTLSADLYLVLFCLLLYQWPMLL